MSFNLEKSKELNKKTMQYLPGGVNYNFRETWNTAKIHFIYGKGTRIWDVDGNEYLDFFCKFGANILGHGNQEYIEALKEAMSKIVATNLCYLEYDVCKKICDCVKSVDKVRFCLSGTEAVQNALRLARAYTKKNKFIRFVSHYHGNADNIMGGKTDVSAGYIPVEYIGDPKGTYGRAKGIMAEQSFLLPWNNVEVLEQIISEHKEEIAAVITEPICVNTKSRYPDPNYFSFLKKLCTENNILLIFDEVITGFRIGLGGAQSLFKIQPDLSVFGKAIAGGALPLSAIGGKSDIMDLYSNNYVSHANTFNGYPLGLAAANVTIDILSRDGGEVYEHMNHYYEKLLYIFKSTATRYGFEIIIHGHPSCSSFSCLKWNGNMNIPQNMLEVVISRSCSDYGILLSNKTTFYANISTNNSDIELFKERIERVFKDACLKLEKIKI